MTTTLPTRVQAPRLWSPRLWGAHAAMVVVVVATIWLGVWQYGVSHQHKADQAAQLAHAAPKPLTDIMGGNDAFPGDGVGRPVVVTGTWSGGTVFVSGHRHDGRDGYWVATPLRVDGTDSAIYVVRGWVADPAQASQAPRGSARFVGWLEPGQQTDTSTGSATGGGSAAGSGSAKDVVSTLDMSALIDRVDVDLFSAYVVGADHQANWPASVRPLNDGSVGLASVPAPALPKADATTGLRNFLYAIEWWLFALFAVYIWWRYVRDVTRVSPPQDDGGVPEDDAQELTVPSDA